MKAILFTLFAISTAYAQSSAAPPGYYLPGGQQQYEQAMRKPEGCPNGTRRYWASKNPLDPFDGCLTPGQAKMFGLRIPMNDAPPGYYLPGGQQSYENAMANRTNGGCPDGTRRYWASKNPRDPFDGCLTSGQAVMFGYATQIPAQIPMRREPPELRTSPLPARTAPSLPPVGRAWQWGLDQYGRSLQQPSELDQALWNLFGRGR